MTKSWNLLQRGVSVRLGNPVNDAINGWELEKQGYKTKTVRLQTAPTYFKGTSGYDWQG